MQPPIEQTNTMEIAAFDWDNTLSPDSTTLYPWVQRMMQVLNDNKKHIVIVTNRGSTDTIKKALPFLKEENIYTSVKAGVIGEREEFQKKPDQPLREIIKADIIEYMVLKDYNDAHPAKPAQLSQVAFTDDSAANLDGAQQRGIVVVPFKSDARNNDPEKDLPVKFLNTVFAPQRVLAQAEHDKQQIKVKDLNGSSEFYNIARATAQQAYRYYAQAGDKGGIIKASLLLAEIYDIKHAVNFGLPAQQRENKDYKARRVHQAYEILTILKRPESCNELLMDSDKAALKVDLSQFFSNIIDQLSNYEKTKTPEEVADLLKSEKLTIAQLKELFQFTLGDSFEPKYKEPETSCCVM